MKKVFILLSVALLWGCASFEKKHFKAVEFFNQNKVLAAEYCSGKFPVIPQFIKGEPIVTIDSVLIDVPFEVDCPDGTKIKEVKKIPCNQETVTTTDTIVTPDKARERVLQSEIDKYKELHLKEKVRAENAEKELKEEEKRRKGFEYAFWGLIGLVGIFVIIKIIRR